jgi:hypothetical protein
LDELAIEFYRDQALPLRVEVCHRLSHLKNCSLQRLRWL